MLNLYTPQKQAEIQHLLEIFLRQSVPPTAPVDPRDIEEWADICLTIAEAKWQRDARGELPVDLIAIDHQRMAAYVDQIRDLVDENRRAKRRR